MTLESHRKACESHAKRLFERATEILGSELVYSNHHIYESDVTKGIIKGAKKSKSDLILMISHRHSGIMGLISSSESQQVIRATKLPVLVI
jgi:nucleotide-binding universal stress UspA family protein